MKESDSAVVLTGVTSNTADNTVFTKSSHGQSTIYRKNIHRE